MKTYQERTRRKLLTSIYIEDSHPYIAEVVEIMPKYQISGKIYSQFLLGAGFLLCKY